MITASLSFPDTTFFCPSSTLPGLHVFFLPSNGPPLSLGLGAIYPLLPTFLSPSSGYPDAASALFLSRAELSPIPPGFRLI